MIGRLISRLCDLFYIAPVRRLVSRQVFCYVFCGGLNFALTIFSYWLAFHFVFLERDLSLGLVPVLGSLVVSPEVAALGISLPVNFLTGFWLQRNVSFRGSPLRGRTQLFRYFLTALGGLLLTYFLTKLLVDVCRVYPTVSQIIIYAFTAVFSFAAQKHFTFRGASGGAAK